LNDAILRVDRGEAPRAPEFRVPRELGLKGREVAMPAIDRNNSAAKVDSKRQNPGLEASTPVTGKATSIGAPEGRAAVNARLACTAMGKITSRSEETAQYQGRMGG
jgi:hypothetical protein